MDLRNSLLSGSSDSFPKDTVEKVVVKSSCVLHDKAISKAVTIVLAVRETGAVFQALRPSAIKAVVG